MADQLKRIGILTGGGDCPGLNAVIRSVAKAAMSGGLEVVGIEDGYLGLIENRMRVLQPNDVSNILTQGGTILGTSNKANPSNYAIQENGQIVMRDVRDQVARNYAAAGLDGLVVIGGDGTMSGAADLLNRGIRVVGVPKTIDNDLWATELTFGHETAVNTATDAIDKLHTTACSHHRIMVIELMGRYAGWLTLHAGIAGGADVILIPEIPFRLESIADACIQRNKRGKHFTIVAVGEGATPAGGKQFVERVDKTSPDPIRLGGVGKYVADEVARLTGQESRSMVLGHIQRGGAPAPRDRVLATTFGYHAFELMMTGQWNQLVIIKNGRLGSVPVAEVANKVRTVPMDYEVLQAARAVGTTFGE